MAHGYFKYTVPTGDRREALRQVGGHGRVLRVHTKGGRTDVYVAAERAGQRGGVSPSEVSLEDVKRIG
jgi:hypothetical protein